MSNPFDKELAATIDALTQPGKGILAADESTSTIGKRFDSIGLASTEESRRAYRDLLLGAPAVGEFISGVILYEETLGQTSIDGTPLPTLAARQGIVPGIKVDNGKIPLALAPGDEITQGLDDLGQRLESYKAQGARFAKWRAVFNITDRLPSVAAIDANAHSLARYAAICQALGIVPIVEPEVLMDGDHGLARCAEVSEAVLVDVFDALRRQNVVLERMILKPGMVLPGEASATKAAPGEVARETLRVLRRTVPAAVPGIFFLSGGQSPEEATAHLDEMNRLGPLPWRLSFSYGRALQDPVLRAWKGQAGNLAAARDALMKRARLNGAASQGRYTRAMEGG